MRLYDRLYFRRRHWRTPQFSRSHGFLRFHPCKHSNETLLAVTAHDDFNGVECVQQCNPVSTLIDIRVGESDSTERLERFFSHFLSHCAESSTLIADVRGYADRDEFPLSIIEHPLERRRQIIGELPVAAAQSLRLNWFDAHYALFCVGGRISTSYEYAMKARRMLPDAALNRRLISAYVAGEEIEGYTLGIMGAHPEILPQLMKALSE